MIQRVLNVAGAVPNLARRNPTDQRVGLDIPVDDRPGGDIRPLADRYPGKDRRSHGDPGVVFDDDLAQDSLRCRRVDGVMTANCQNFAGDVDVAPDRQGAASIEGGKWTDNAVRSDVNITCLKDKRVHHNVARRVDVHAGRAVQVHAQVGKRNLADEGIEQVVAKQRVHHRASAFSAGFAATCGCFSSARVGAWRAARSARISLYRSTTRSICRSMTNSRERRIAPGRFAAASGSARTIARAYASGVGSAAKKPDSGVTTSFIAEKSNTTGGHPHAIPSTSTRPKPL